MRMLAMMVMVIALTGTLNAAQLLLPEKRTNYYSGETVEIAVSGLEKGRKATVKIAPATPDMKESEGKKKKRKKTAAKELELPTDAKPVSIPVTGDGGSIAFELPPYSLAPGAYHISIDGDAETNPISLNITRGIWPSTMLVSQAGSGWSNFRVSNAFQFGLTDRDRQPTDDPRSRSNLKRYDDLILQNIPAIIYMYWTGYVLHKPWGIHKEWAAPDEIENMRLFNYHVAQRLRRFDKLLYSIGSLDEPGLPWGRTASGGAASGFAGWNVAGWMKEHGLAWTDDPGSLSDKDFRRYMQLRALMLREAFQQANKDIKEPWPTAVYATDSYAPQAVGDGTDPMNQVANDIPTTHVFADYGIGKLGVLAGMYIEKAHDPTSKLAHAMNGQLFGFENVMRYPAQLYAYHVMMNVMLAAGLDSNWWLNYWRIGTDENGKRNNELMVKNTERVNEPAARVGPLFKEMAPSDHDVAVLWSNTEIWMRVKGVMKVEASNANGEQKALMVADLPEDAMDKDGKLKYNAYSVGGNYKGEVMSTLMAINRAGYPAHVLHEDRLNVKNLAKYKVLVITHQTHELPAAKRKAIEEWEKKGGKVIVDKTSTVKFPGEIVVDAPSVVNQGYNWSSKFGEARKKDLPDNKRREATYYQTNHFMESFSRKASKVYGAALAKTSARQVMATETVELACERHVGGDGELIMVINGYEELPKIKDTEGHVIWNYAPYKATYSLPIINKTAAVYCVEGLDWKKVTKLKDPTAPQSVSFQPGEMKLYVVAPQEPKGLDLQTKLDGGEIKVNASLKTLKMPWLLEVSVTDPAGKEIVKLNRATNVDGVYSEIIPLGLNAKPGNYTVKVSSPIGKLVTTAKVVKKDNAVKPIMLTNAVRIFDKATIKTFLASKPAITVAYANDAQKPLAEKLAKALKDKGIKATAAPEKGLWHKSLYPRVWDPYAPVFTAKGETKPLPKVWKLDEKKRPVRDEKKKPIMEPGKITQELTVESEFYETPTYTTKEGKPFKERLERGTLLTVGPKGYVKIGGQETFYEPGVKLFVGDRNKIFALNAERESVKTNDAFRKKWARPWARITGHVGGNNLTPQLPEAYVCDHNLILLGDSKTGGTLVRALQASELLPQVVDQLYPGPGKALIQYAWSPFALGKNVIYVGAVDQNGLEQGIGELEQLIK